jgi:hypothetical protein
MRTGRRGERERGGRRDGREIEGKGGRREGEEGKEEEGGP